MIVLNDRQLIAAAPKMLAAIQSLLKYNDDNQRFHTVMQVREIDLIKLRESVQPDEALQPSSTLPSTGFAVKTPHQEQVSRELLEFTPQELIDFQHLHNFSPRQRDTTSMAVMGRTDEEIAAKLEITVQTVRKYMASAGKKFGIRKREELVDFLSQYDPVAAERKEDEV